MASVGCIRIFLFSWAFILFIRRASGNLHLKGSDFQNIRRIQTQESDEHLIEHNSSIEPNYNPPIPPDTLCRIGYFGCKKNPELCVPQAAICDKKSDCPDSSDEIDCQNSHEDRFYDQLFRPRHDKDSMTATDDICKYANVSVLSGNDVIGIGIPNLLHDNDGIIMEEDELSLYTVEGCECIWEKFICQNLELRNLSTIPMDVEDLDLSGSTVETLDFNSPHGFPELRHLVLSSCSIQNVDRGAFYKLHKLETLHLTDNQLQRIPNGTFLGNVNLLKLFLGYNKISTIESGAFEDLSVLFELDMRHNLISTTKNNIFIPLKSLRILDLSHNKIQMMEWNSFASLEKLQVLSLPSNEITFIQKNSFQHLKALKNLYLSWNKLTALESLVFCNLYALVDLRLNDNELVQIEPEAFSCLHNLQSLNLMRNRFRELKQPELIFANLTKLQHIQFDHFWMCGWAQHVRLCQPKGDGISSDKNLLDNVILRTCVWIMGLVGVFGNLFVIVSRLILREPNRIHSFYIKNLAVADLLMGIFLLSIAIHDQKFRGNFLQQQHYWRHSITCQVSGLMGTWSSEASVLMLALITLDRYLSIARPFADKGISLSPAILIIGLLWLISFLLSYLPLSGFLENYFGNDFYTTNGLCLPLQIHNPYDAGWEYSFILFVILNTTAFGFISYAYWNMLRIIQNSALRLRTNQLKQDGILAKRFGLIVLTDFFCWAPVITTKILAMAGVAIHPDLYAWLAVFVLPVNSALNPIIYTLTTKLFIQQVSKATLGIQQRWTRRRASEDSSISLSLFNRARAQRVNDHAYIFYNPQSSQGQQQTITTSIQTSVRCTKARGGRNTHTLVASGVPVLGQSANATLKV